MFLLEGIVEIGKYTFKSVHEIEYEKSVDTLADTAIIRLPNRFKIKDAQKSFFTEQAIKIGDKVTVTLGYQDRYSGKEFTGYVKKIKPTIPLEIHCEDSFWLLRRKNITKSWRGSVELKEILAYVVQDTGVKLAPNIPEFPIDNFIIRNANGAQVLEKIREEFRLSAFINDNGELYCGLRQLTNIGEEVIYDLQYNLVENNLEFTTKEEKKIKIRYTYIAPNGKRKTIEVGDKDGELRTYHTSIVSNPDKLKQMAEEEIKKLKYDGFEGDVVSFLIPYATRGMKAKIIDQDYKHRQGNYFIKKVRVTFNTQGARRIVYLGTKI